MLLLHFLKLCLQKPVLSVHNIQAILAKDNTESLHIIIINYNMLYANHGYLFHSLNVYVFHWICGLYVFLIKSLESTSKKMNRMFIFIFYINNILELIIYECITKILYPIASATGLEDSLALNT